MAIGGDVDWLVGSPELPELKFSPVEFDPDKFTSDIMADPPPKAGGGKSGEQEDSGEWTEGGGAAAGEKPEVKEAEGLKGKKEPKEDVSKMTDDQRFLRACELIGDVGDQAKAKPLAEMQLNEKVKKIKSKYKIDKITVDADDGQAEVTVKHKDKDNKKEPIKVKLMSAAEMMKLAQEGKTDLEAMVKAKEDPKEHTMLLSDAEAIAAEIAEKHYVFESVEVTQKGDRFEYVLDLAGQKMAVAGSGVKAEKVETATGSEAEGQVEITAEDKSLHLEIIKTIKKELETDGNHDSFEKFRQEKLELAKELEAKHQKKLKPQIKLTIKAKDQLDDLENGQLAFHIKIAPNTSEDDEVLQFDGTKEAEIIHALGERTPEPERKVLYEQVKALLDSDLIMLKIHEHRKARKSSLFRTFFAKIIAENLKNGYQLTRVEQNQKLYWKYRGLADIKKSISIEDVYGNTINGIQNVGEAKQVGQYLQLNFLIPDRIKEAGVRGVGKKMLTEAVTHFQSNIEGIKAEWTNGSIYRKTNNKMSDNLEKYLIARLSGLSEEDSVKKTWTYIQAAKLGYPRVKSGSITENSALQQFIIQNKHLDEARRNPDTLQVFAELIPESEILIPQTKGESI